MVDIAVPFNNFNLVALTRKVFSFPQCALVGNTFAKVEISTLSFGDCAHKSICTKKALGIDFQAQNY